MKEVCEAGLFLFEKLFLFRKTGARQTGTLAVVVP